MAKGNLNKLNFMIKVELTMKNNREYDTRINKFLFGLNKIKYVIGKMIIAIAMVWVLIELM